MRIGFFTTDFPFKGPFSISEDISQSWGGVAEVTYNLALKLSSKHEIRIFTTSPVDKEMVQTYDNIIVYRYKKNFKFENTDMSFDLIRKPLKHDVDIIHIHRGSVPGAIAGYLYVKLKKKPCVLTYHGDPETMSGSIMRRFSVSFFNICIHHRILDRADAITTFSNQFLDVSKFLRRYRDKIKIIPNGINLDDFDVPYSKEEGRNKLRLSTNKKVILFVGGLTERKNPHILLRAMPIILKSISNVELIIVGKGLMLNELKELSQQLDVNSNVKFAGFVDENEKLQYYRSADIFVLPSLVEAFPVVLLEASAFGLPLVVSDLEAFKAIVEEGYNGLFTKTGDENDLAEKVLYLLENEDIREKMGENARKKIKDYSWDKIAEETEKVYNEVIS